MAASGVSVSPECITKFNELKLSKDIKYIIYKLSDNAKEIEVEETSKEADWSTFRERLLNAKSKNKSGKEVIGARYAVYDVEYDAPNDEGKRNKITFIAWSPDDSPVQEKMIYSSSKEALKRALNGIAAEVQANDPEDIEYDSIVEKFRKGRY